MKKAISITVICSLVLLLAGCAGTTVVVGDCTCPAGSHSNSTSSTENDVSLTEGSVKSGLAIVANAADSADGSVTYDVTLAAVTVDDDGVIHACTIDSLSASVLFPENGEIISDLDSIPTKNEMGTDYGMVTWGGAIGEWCEQAAALADFSVGKTVSQLRSGAIDESGYAPDGSDLSTSATIYLAGYVDAIEAAVNNATHLGAESGDTLKLVSINTVSDSVSATADHNGCAQLDCNVALITEKEDTITSCVIDSLQAKVEFDTNSVLLTDVTAAMPTKNELGADYGMVTWGGAIAEWNQQAAAFAAYVTGKTAGEVADIAVTDSTKPADGTDLSTSVTIAIGGFQALIAKAMQ